MSINDVRDEDIFKKFEKNNAFTNKYYEVLREFDSNITMQVVGGKLIISNGEEPIIENNNFSISRKFEIFIDDYGNLTINEMTGYIQLNREEGYGRIDTNYSCKVYDPDGVEISKLEYSDHYAIRENQFEPLAKRLHADVEGAYNPKLSQYVYTEDFYPSVDVRGEEPNYIKMYREEDSLGVVDRVEGIYNVDGTISITHELYYNTFEENHVSVHPELIGIRNKKPFATYGKNNRLMFNSYYARDELNEKNYKEKANKKFLQELINNRQTFGMNNIESRYDFMIKMLEKMPNKGIGTM